MRRALRTLCCLLLAASLLGTSLGRAESNAGEYRLKAVLLSKLFDFVYWPESAAPERRTLCVIGDDPFGTELEAAFAARRNVTLRRSASLGSDTGSCDVLYISGSEQRGFAEVLAAVADRPVLTISDIPHFATNGGMINLALVNRRVRFRINQRALEVAGLEVSYKLLKLADVVETRPERSSG